jgi:hypothetical protein
MPMKEATPSERGTGSGVGRAAPRKDAVDGSFSGLARIPLDLIGRVGKFDSPAAKLLNGCEVYRRLLTLSTPSR